MDGETGQTAGLAELHKNMAYPLFTLPSILDGSHRPPIGMFLTSCSLNPLNPDLFPVDEPYNIRHVFQCSNALLFHPTQVALERLDSLQTL